MAGKIENTPEVKAIFDQLLQDFENCESENPLEGGWEFFVKHTAATVYRRLKPGESLYEYQTLCELYVPIDVAMATFVDLDYRRDWDTYVKELTPTTPGGPIYWCVNYPFPMSNRDYIFTRHAGSHSYKGLDYQVIMDTSALSEDFPVIRGVQRVTKFFQHTVLRPRKDDPNVTDAYIKYFDDPGGIMPSWLVNWAGKTAIPKFLDSTRKACVAYPKYKAGQTAAITKDEYPASPTDVEGDGHFADLGAAAASAAEGVGAEVEEKTKELEAASDNAAKVLASAATDAVDEVVSKVEKVTVADL